MAQWLVTAGAESRIIDSSAANPLEIADELFRITGQAPKVTPYQVPEVAPTVTPTEESNTARIDRLQAAMVAGGMTNVGGNAQFYANGTKLLDGYGPTDLRLAHEKLGNVRDEVSRLIDTVRAEKRHDVVISAGALADSIVANGTLRVLDGYRLQEQAIRGLFMRLNSPAILKDYPAMSPGMSYMLALRERAILSYRTGGDAGKALATEDVARAAEVLRTELKRKPGVRVKLRTRESLKDIFALVSPTYQSADADSVLPDIVDDLPQDAKASIAYNPITTAWETRVALWTPTPDELVRVGEPLDTWMALRSRDDGGGSLKAGGGATIVRCVNCSVYFAEGGTTSRQHRGRIRYDIPAMVRQAAASMRILVNAWGAARAVPVAVPIVDDAPVPMHLAVEGYWRWLLTDRRSELAAVLPGRTEQHVSALRRVFDSERRDLGSLVKSDFGQGWTKYLQRQPEEVQREGEAAVSRFLLDKRPLQYVAAE
jgi:hypothetical protein